jgi:hypothetical protein
VATETLRVLWNLSGHHNGQRQHKLAAIFKADVAIMRWLRVKRYAPAFYCFGPEYWLTA